MSIELTVYTRAGCHLCEDMESHLHTLSGELGFTLLSVDIDERAELVERYGTRVPVLMLQDQFICEYFLDRPALLKALKPDPV